MSFNQGRIGPSKRYSAGHQHTWGPTGMSSSRPP